MTLRSFLKMSKQIKDFEDGLTIDTQFLVSAVSKGVKADGGRYLNVTIQDSTGSIEAKKWEVSDEDLLTLTPGNVVGLYGQVYQYKNSLQFKIFEARKLNADNIDFSRFVKSCPVEKETLIEKLNFYLDNIKDEEIKRFTKALIDKFYPDYVTFPAAVRNHHAFGSGLLYHSITMADMASKMCEVYPSLNKDILIAGCLLHDVGKTKELSGPITTKYTLEGRLIGHISIMQAEIKKVADELNIDPELSILMQHMILSHHGVPEFGSAVVPMTREALALSTIDNFDAKMQVLDNAFEGVQPGEFTQRIFALDNLSFYKPSK